MTDTFAVDLAGGTTFQLPKYFVGGKIVNFSGNLFAYDTLDGGVAPRTAGGKSGQTLMREANMDFLTWSAFTAANYDNYNPADINQQQWRSLLDAALLVVRDGGAISPGFTCHGPTGPLVMGSYSPYGAVTYAPEDTTNVAASNNDFSREQAGKYLLAMLNGGGPTGAALSDNTGGDISRVLPAEISNEPATNNPQQYGGGGSGQRGVSYPTGRGWYNDPLTAGQKEEDFHTNILPYYADYFASLGFKTQGYSYSNGPTSGDEQNNSLRRFVNCYEGSRQWQSIHGSKNLGHFDHLALHCYNQVSDGQVAGANGDDPQQCWNTIFHTSGTAGATPTNYDIHKDGFVGGLREKRALFNQLGGSNVPFHLSEQWMIDGRAGFETTQNATQSMADIVAFIATVQNAQSWFLNGQGGGYVLHCINASQINGTYDASTSWPVVSDFMFGYKSGVLHSTGRYYALKHFMCKFGNRNGYQRLLGVTQTSTNTPATVLGNAVPSIQGVAGLNAAGTEMCWLVANIDMSNSHPVNFSWTGSASTGNVTGEKWAGGTAIPLDTAPTSLGTLATGGANSFSLTLAAGDCVVITVPISTSTGGGTPASTQIPAVSGSTVQGAIMTRDVGLWTQAPTSYTTAWYRCDPNGANPVSLGISTTTYTTVVGDVGSTLRVGVIATNPSGASAEVLSNPTGVITSSGGGSSLPILIGIPPVHVSPEFSTSGTASVSIGTLTQGLLMFHFHRKFDSDALTSVTFNGVSMTLLTTQTDGGHSIATEVWYMVGPPTSGTYTLAWTKSGVSQNIGWAEMRWTGVDQTHPFGTPSLYTGAGGASGQVASATLAAIANDVVVSVGTFNIAAADPTHGSGQTAIYGTHQSTTQLAASYKTVTSAGNINVSESASAAAANYALVAYVIRGNATGAAPVNNSAPILTGAPVEQQQQTSTAGSWNDPSATFTYRYESATPVTFGGVATIRAASSDPTYTIAVGTVGKVIRAVVIATNSFGSAEAPTQWSATVTSPGVTTPPLNTTAPVASGGVNVGGTVSVDTGLYEASHPPITFTYEWRRKRI